MRLTEALDIVLKRATKEAKDEPHRIVEGHLRHLRNKEEGTLAEPTKVQEYQEYHHGNVDDIGVAYNEDRVWVCLDGVSLFRAKVVGDKLLSEYHPRDKQYKWRAALKGTAHNQQVRYNRKLEEKHERLKKEIKELKR